MDIRIADDGEVLVRGGTVMKGYHDDEASTALAICNGWLHTGDIGELDGEFLRVTGRKKDIIVTANGRAIPPAPIEATLRACPFIEEAVVHGDRRPFLTALVTVQREAVSAWAAANGLSGLDVKSLVHHARVYQLVRDAIDELNGDLPPHEHIRRFAILDEEFGPRSGEMTPSGSARRRFISEKYANALDALYEGNGSPQI
jgi:long-chain acyl-CoA synthetase